MAPVPWEPLIPTAPDQPPDALQEVALVEDQVKVELPPEDTLAGLALKETVGGAETVIVADCDAVPPAPLQLKVNFVVALSAAVTCEPVVAWVPLQPPEALHEVALVEDHVNVEVAPLFTVVGFAAKVTAGAGVLTDTVADCAALPPAPLQVSV
jgi:hypothetical protein